MVYCSVLKVSCSKPYLYDCSTYWNHTKTSWKTFLHDTITHILNKDLEFRAAKAPPSKMNTEEMGMMRIDSQCGWTLSDTPVLHYLWFLWISHDIAGCSNTETRIPTRKFPKPMHNWISFQISINTILHVLTHRLLDTPAHACVCT